MGFNKKELSKATANLDARKTQSKPRDIIYDPMGQWKHPGQPTRIPGGNITMQGVPYPVMAYPNVGQPQMMYPEQDYNFAGADYVDEYPQMKRGGTKKFSRDITATNIIFTKNPYLKKKKSKKKKIFDPNAQYFQYGGQPISTQDEPDVIYTPSMEMSSGGMTQYKEGGKLGPIPINSGRKVLRDWTYGESIGMLQEDDGGYIETELTPEEIEVYRQGGYVVEEMDEFQGGGQIYMYPGRKHTYYKKDSDGSWLIKNKDTGWKYTEIKDPTGSRSKLLNSNAIPVNKKSTQGSSQETPFLKSQAVLNKDAKPIVANKSNTFNFANPGQQYAQMQNLSYEDKLDRLLGSPMDKAWAIAGRGVSGKEGPVDNIRHPMAGYYTARNLGVIPGIPIANTLGVAHELGTLFTDPREWKYKLGEAGEDIFNNFVGTLLSPFSEKQAYGVVKYLSDNNLLPDGLAIPEGHNAYVKKQDGGPTMMQNPFITMKDGSRSVLYTNKNFNDYIPTLPEVIVKPNRGKKNKKRTDSNLENIIEILDPTGISSWDDVYRSYKETGVSPETALEVLGAIPLVGKLGKLSKSGIHLTKHKGLNKFLYKNLPKSNKVSNTFRAAGISGRASDAKQAYDQWQNGGDIFREYKKGGSIDLELTPEEIEWYKSQGYEVEELD